MSDLKHRNYILLYINGHRIKVQNEHAFMPLADFLRYVREETGTKIVCAEGDCGACTVLSATLRRGDSSAQKLNYLSFNSCIMPVFLLDCCSVVTVEGLTPEDSRTTGELDPIQESFVDCNASQCGFCTPGFIMAAAGLYERKEYPTARDVQNYLTGNLCRCTGYDSIIEAGISVATSQRVLLQERYFDTQANQELIEHLDIPVKMEISELRYNAPCTLAAAVEIQNAFQPKLIAGATDLGVQINKGYLKTQTFLDLRLIEEMYLLEETSDAVLVGAKITWETLRSFTKTSLPEFSDFLNIFASPQIKNVGTLVGNVANGSPIGDSLPYLMMAEATVHLAGIEGRRIVPMTEFYKGYKVLDMQDGELITHISIPKAQASTHIKLYKISARRDLDIACVGMACSMQLDGNRISELSVAFGGVGPVVKRLTVVEEFLKGKEVNSQNIKAAVALIRAEIAPISDVRGSKTFRITAAKNLLRKFFFETKKTALLAQDA